MTFQKAINKKNKIVLQNEKYFEVPGHNPEIEGSKEKRRRGKNSMVAGKGVCEEKVPKENE